MKIIFGILVIGLLALTGCDKSPYDYKKFLENKEIVYAGLAENISYRSGNLRVQLQWEKSIDPAVVSYYIYWNNNKDSAIVPATAADANGIYRYTVTGLPEYVQSFLVVAQNDRGGRSVGQSITGVRVFGPIYNSTLNNQRLGSGKYFRADSAILTFIKTDTSKIFSKIYYYKNDGSQDSATFNNDVVTVRSFMPGSKPAIRSYYKPTPNAIDTFAVLNVDSLPAFNYTAFTTSTFVSASSPAQEGSLANLLDDNAETYYASKYSSPTPAETYPFTFVLSTGANAMPVRGVYFNSRLTTRAGDAKDVEIYTSDDNVTYTSRGAVSLRSSPNRFEYLFPNGIVTTRYVKIIIRNGYTTNAYVVFGEMNLLK